MNRRIGNCSGKVEASLEYKIKQENVKSKGGRPKFWKDENEAC